MILKLSQHCIKNGVGARLFYKQILKWFPIFGPFCICVTKLVSILSQLCNFLHKWFSMLSTCCIIYLFFQNGFHVLRSFYTFSKIDTVQNVIKNWSRARWPARITTVLWIRNMHPTAWHKQMAMNEMDEQMLKRMKIFCFTQWLKLDPSFQTLRVCMR